MSATAAEQAQFQVVPFTPTPERAGVVSAIVRGCMQVETIFSDYTRACDTLCGECERCIYCRASIAAALAKPDTRTWEVWRVDSETPELVGIVYASRITPGVDAEAHFCFFDGRLRGKEGVIEALIEWAFADHEDWYALPRITIAVPDYAWALARFAHKHLGFDGPFEYEHKGNIIRVEGVRRSCILWRGMRRDVLLLGKLNPHE